MPVDPSYVQNLEKKAAEYVAMTRPRLEKLAGYEASRRKFVKRAAQCVGTLVGLGLVERSRASAMIDKMAEDPVSVFDVVETIAPSVRAGEMGAASEKSASTGEIDPFVEVFGSKGAVSDGMID